jgi:hypothetical protein
MFTVTDLNKINQWSSLVRGTAWFGGQAESYDIPSITALCTTTVNISAPFGYTPSNFYGSAGALAYLISGSSAYNAIQGELVFNWLDSGVAQVSALTTGIIYERFCADVIQGTQTYQLTQQLDTSWLISYISDNLEYFNTRMN